MLTTTELQLAAKLLDMAANEFGNHGCNDFELPNTDENHALVLAMEAANETPADCIRKRPRKPKPIYTEDFALMGYLADRLREEAEKAGG